MSVDAGSVKKNDTYFADVNGDGKADMIIRSNAATGQDWVYVGLANGDGSFQRWSWYGHAGCGCSYDTYFADVNGDGKADLIIRSNAATGQDWVYVGLANGDGSFQIWSWYGHARSDECRVGKECRSRWAPNHEKKIKNNAAD